MERVFQPELAEKRLDRAAIALAGMDEKCRVALRAQRRKVTLGQQGGDAAVAELRDVGVAPDHKAND